MARKNLERYMRRAVYTVVLECCLAFGGAARASAESPAGGEADLDTWLHFNPPPECPGSDHIVQRLGEWLDGPLPGPNDLQVHSEITWTGGHWLSTVDVLLKGVPGRRSVQVDSCSDAADFVAVAIVLSVEPENRHGLPSEPVVEANALPVPEKTEEPPQSPSPEPQDVSQGEARGEPSEGVAVANKRPKFFLGGSGLAASGILPGVHGGFALHAAVRAKHWDFRIEARSLLPAAYLPPGAAAPVEFSWVGGRAVGCYSWDWGRISAGPCLFFEAGAILADQQGQGSGRDLIATPWLGVGGIAEVAYSPNSAISLYAAASLDIPIREITLELDNGVVAYQPQTGVHGDLGVRFFFGAK